MRSGVYWKVYEHSKSKSNEEIKQKTKVLNVKGAIAQLGEHRLCKPRVVGSIPTGSTTGLKRNYGCIRKKANKNHEGIKGVIDVLGDYH